MVMMNRHLMHRQNFHTTTASTISSGKNSPQHGVSSSCNGEAQRTFPAPQGWYNKHWILLVTSFAGFFYLSLDSAIFYGGRRHQKEEEDYDDYKKANSWCENVGVNDDGSYEPQLDADSNDYWPVIPDQHWSCMTRAFVPWNNATDLDEQQHSWCHRWPKSGTSTSVATRDAGLTLIKVHKAASSTLAGVNMRIAHRYGNCKSLQHHEDSRVYHNRSNGNANNNAVLAAAAEKKSFMYTSIRHPVHRAISWIFYTYSNEGIVSMTDELVLQRLRMRTYNPSGTGVPSDRNLNEAGAQVGYMHTGQHLPHPLWDAKRPRVVQNFTTAMTRVQQVMNQYDFVVIVERLSESLVVLQLLLHLKPTDILYLSAKKSGGYSYNTKPNPGCHKLIKPHISPAVHDYLSSSQWMAQNYEDYLLYKAANASLDRTIAALGRRRFDQALAEYQALMLRAKECEESAIFHVPPREQSI
jgi:Galactose-3-O-sulfotransferase